MNKWLWTLIVFSVLGITLVGIFYNLNYKPEEIVKNYLISNEKVNVLVENNFVLFNPINKNDIDIIFYPGGFVYPEAYSPLCFKIAENGYRVFLVKMPLNLAVLKPNAAKEIIDKFNLDKVVLIGHSLGGAMAAKFVYDNPETISGLVLLAAYPGKSNNISKYNIKVLSIFGEFDGLATIEKIETHKNLLPDNTKYVMINGGNHSNFGYYGFQKGDNPSLIYKDEQQKIILNNILEFLKNLK